MAIQRVSKGTFYKRDRIYWYSYRITDETSRRRVSISLGTSIEKEARNKVREIRLRLDLGIDPVETNKQNININEAINQYRDYSKTTKAPKTIIRDEVTLKRFATVFGNKSVGRITKQEIEEYFGQIQGRKPRSVNREIVTIKGLFTKIAEWGIRPDSPAKGVTQRKVQPTQIRWLTDDEIKSVLDNCQGWWREFSIFMLESGLRLGEFLAIQPHEDINIKNRTIQVRASKTYQVRPCRITDRMLGIIKIWQDRGSWCPYSPNNVSRGIRLIGEKIDPPIDISPHTFRHTFASRLVMSGVNLRTVQALMGHARIETTMIYSHLSPDYLNDAERTGYTF